MSKLVIVESPAKAKTIKKYLGSGYEVVASMGHIRDLPQSKIGIDIENDFAPQYVNIRGKADLIKSLKNAAAQSDAVFLATDPDREGEAISWHLANILALNLDDENRITFNEITKQSVAEGIKNPRKINIDLVDAQQARRVLDRLVGYKISPFLWKKIRHGLSAGRVQSVAVKIIVDREREIRAFVPDEYWTVDAVLSTLTNKTKFNAKFYGTDEGKLEITNEADAKAILAEIENNDFVVGNVKKGVRNKRPMPPFITSTLQQDASRKLGYTSKRTMRIAQTLYEGVDVTGLGTTGLITYMRTDSLRISEEARAAGEKYIIGRFGQEYLPEKRTYYKTKAGAQDAHEAIRPTMPDLTPDKVKADLTPEQFKLYELIWSRFIASLMAPCVQNTVNVDIFAGKYLFKASGYTVKFEGYTVVYEDDKDDDKDSQKGLPAMAKGDILKLISIAPNQHFTQPPARYNEASLIKLLEEKGIGRPSTFATIISTILAHEYVKTEKKYLVPTPLGEIVNEQMENHFGNIVDIKFTAGMESKLDEVEEGEIKWVKMISDFYSDFSKTLESAEQSMSGVRIKVPEEETDVVCENCGRKMVIKSGRFGKFLACPGYPECKNTKPITVETKGNCPKCGSKMLQKKSAKGHKYFGCENKECKFMTWDEPTSQTCPNCGKSLFKARGGIVKCLDEACGYEKKSERKSKKNAEEDS